MFSIQRGKFLRMQQHLGAGPHRGQDDETWPIPPGLHTSGVLGGRIHEPWTRDLSLQRVHMHRKAQTVRTSEELPRCHQRLETPEAAEQVSPFSFHYTLGCWGQGDSKTGICVYTECCWEHLWGSEGSWSRPREKCCRCREGPSDPMGSTKPGSAHRARPAGGHAPVTGCGLALARRWNTAQLRLPRAVPEAGLSLRRQADHTQSG